MDMVTKNRTEPYKIYELLRVNMYHRVNGVRMKREHTVEELENLIEEVMDKLYILHREELEKSGLVRRVPKNRADEKKIGAL